VAPTAGLLVSGKGRPVIGELAPDTWAEPTESSCLSLRSRGTGGEAPQVRLATAQ